MLRTAVFLLGLVACTAHDEGDVYVGQLLAVSRERIELSRNETVTHIGFVGDPPVLAELDGLKAGDEVRAVFGSSPSGNINKLLSIRRCGKADAQCASDGKAQDAKDAEAARLHAVSAARSEQCDRRMSAALLDDPRFAAPTRPLSKAQSQALSREVHSLTGQRHECATAVMNDHLQAVLEACELHHCSDEFAGGCSHSAGYSLSDAVLERALAQCKDVTSTPGR